ncbi:hypothetical protein EIN_381110 [Entamoeba invadens IP1]|uniref:Transmembrane protein n=1 Tax=Entamoeba invadens IP1 TaxID=370355 RepID=A0A0A1UG21_ENTIV|nr:hypothetical protein EIN_381110 [Entamoeba invadens IP1]ELP92154.1 hypothetical protein EIN_381110 [Entamoeba invadens IP1]|eukprot:XP_004258925.1 hypothetical protein EIN_381110 [Entamoeba invadens IP1]
MGCCALVKRAAIGAIIGIILTVIAIILIFPFVAVSFVYSKDLKDYNTCISDYTLEDMDIYHFVYESGYWFALLNVVFLAGVAIMTILSFIPCVGCIGWIITCPAACGCIPFIVIGSLCLVWGTGMSVDTWQNQQKYCFEKTYNCCFNETGCVVPDWSDYSESSNQPEKQLTEEASQSSSGMVLCGEKPMEDNDFSVTLIAVSLICGGFFMACYPTITGSTSSSEIKTGKKKEYEALG